MNLIKDKNYDINYLAKVIMIDAFTQHPNPKCTKLKLAKVDAYSIIVGLDEKPGLKIYFPVLSRINPNLLAYANLYQDSELNNDVNKKGFFSSNGRVKAIKLQQYPSEGFLMDYKVLQDFVESVTAKKLPLVESGTEFDSVQEGEKTFWICKKYVNNVPKEVTVKHNKKQKLVKKFNRVIDSQFRFHYDTVLIRNSPYSINKDDIIHLSSKWHGTSGISAYVLCKHQLTWKEKIAKFLTGYEFNKYEHLYASRKVIKNKTIANSGFYGAEDGREDADKILQPIMTKGMTIYYELVGFAKNGTYWQKDYDYGCTRPIDGYVCGHNFKILVYRITLTNIDGIVHEFSTQDVQNYVHKWNIEGVIPVRQFYYGKARDLYPELETSENWSLDFINKLADDKRFDMELDSPDCLAKVPAEGIVIKKESSMPQAWKLKSFRFLGIEQQRADAGEIDNE